MARSKHTQTFQHFVAMQLILSMQDTTPGAADPYPNIAYVIARDETQRMVPEADIYNGLNYLRDLLTLVDQQVYIQFRNAIQSNLNVDGVQLNHPNCQAMVASSMAFLHSVADGVGVEMWESPPHPCFYISREVVAELLA